MNSFKIDKFNPCSDMLNYYNKFTDFHTFWDNCQRGDWMLWMAKKLNVDLLKLTTAKALCANTVRHLMKDKRSTKAIDVAILFGQGLATKEELNAAAHSASLVVSDNFNAAYYVAFTAFNATTITAESSNIVSSYTSAYSSSFAAYYSANPNFDSDAVTVYVSKAIYFANDDDDARNKAIKQNQFQTAYICRQILTEVVFESIEKLK